MAYGIVFAPLRVIMNNLTTVCYYCQYEKSGYEPAYGGRSSDFHHQSSRWPLAKSPRLIIVASMVVKL